MAVRYVDILGIGIQWRYQQREGSITAVLISPWGKAFPVRMVCKVSEHPRSLGAIYHHHDSIFWEPLVLIYFSHVFRISGDMLDGNRQGLTELKTAVTLWS